MVEILLSSFEPDPPLILIPLGPSIWHPRSSLHVSLPFPSLISSLLSAPQHQSDWRQVQSSSYKPEELRPTPSLPPIVGC